MLASQLLESLDRENQKRIDAIWGEEAERRMQEIRDGKVQAIDGEEVMRRLRERRKEAAYFSKHHAIFLLPEVDFDSSGFECLTPFRQRLY